MTGNELFDTAVDLMGLKSQKSELYRYAEICIISVYNDLWYKLNVNGNKPFNSLNDEIELDERIVNDIMPYGVAMYLALILSDGEKQQFYAQVYNQKRLSLSSMGSVRDVLPVPN